MSTDGHAQEVLVTHSHSSTTCGFLRGTTERQFCCGYLLKRSPQQLQYTGLSSLRRRKVLGRATRGKAVSDASAGLFGLREDPCSERSHLPTRSMVRDLAYLFATYFS
jgi:hypothetical protein